MVADGVCEHIPDLRRRNLGDSASFKENASGFTLGRSQLCLRFDAEHCYLSQHARGRRHLFAAPGSDTELWLQPDWQDGALKDSTVVAFFRELTQRARMSTAAHVFGCRLLLAVGNHAARWFEGKLDSRATPLGRLGQLLAESQAYQDLDNSSLHVTSAVKTLRVEYYHLKQSRARFEQMCSRKSRTPPCLSPPNLSGP